MVDFPLVRQLPTTVETVGWKWKPFGCRTAPTDFWVGIDQNGNQWLAKMRGSFRGYRELVFERLVQELGWSCQSSTFAVLQNDAAPLLVHPDAERTQLLTWLLPEHAAGSCGPACSYYSVQSQLRQKERDPLDVLRESGLRDYKALALKEILAPLLGGNEPAGHLITTDHRVVMIDGELMFSSEPSDPRETSWWLREDESPSELGQQLTQEACHAVGSLSDKHLDACLEISDKIQVTFLWDIRNLLFKARDHARISSFLLAESRKQ